MNEPARYVRVVPEDSYERAYDYALPESLLGKVKLGMKVRIPLRNHETKGWVTELLTQCEYPKIRAILDLSSDQQSIPAALFALARWMADYYCAPIASCLRCVLPEPIRAEMGHKERQWIEARTLDAEGEKSLASLKLKRHREAYDYIKKRGGGWLLDIERASGFGRMLWRTLADKGYVTIGLQSQEREPEIFDQALQSQFHGVNPEQEAALALWRTEKAKPKARPLLIHGVTGSGKTEVYLQAIGEVLSEGGTALMIVPEIALTPQAIERLRSRFLGRKIRVAILHSHLSRGEKHDQWQQARDGRARVVIGARSAVFAPLPDLRLIVVDEEHEQTYKQEEAPHYHGRDLAVMRAYLENATVLLGSATPSLESWHNAQTGKYALATLANRVAARPMPTVHIVDTRKKRQQTESPMLSPRLREAIEQCTARGEQSILYLNRRGHSTSLQCPDCGHVQTCDRCSVSLTYHRTVDQLRCHFCDYSAPAPQQCPECSSRAYRYSGLGTQKIEEAIEAELPKARVLRMDSDSMRGKNAYAVSLARFGRGEVDVLVGTQMIAKGLDFPQVTCVGVIHVDGALQIPDFRSGERVFQQLMQVAGRAGRGDKGGAVYIQTRTPFHPAIAFARHHDYTGFVEQEMEFRVLLQYPPYRRLILIRWKGRNEEKTLFVAGKILEGIKSQIGEIAEVGEAIAAPIAKIDHHFRFHAMILTTKVVECARRIRPGLLEVKPPEGVQMSVDVDPLSLM